MDELELYKETQKKMSEEMQEMLDEKVNLLACLYLCGEKELRAKTNFPLFATAANKLLSVHVTTAAAERNWSSWGRTYINTRNRLGLLVAEKLIYVKANYGDMQLAGDELVALDVC